MKARARARLLSPFSLASERLRAFLSWIFAFVLLVPMQSFRVDLERLAEVQ